MGIAYLNWVPALSHRIVVNLHTEASHQANQDTLSSGLLKFSSTLRPDIYASALQARVSVGHSILRRLAKGAFG